MNYSSGINAVDQMLNFDFSGSVVLIHPAWFDSIVDDNGRTDLLAINILADVVYWYRPVINIDEQTGQMLGYRKRFTGDMYKKSIGDYCKRFNAAKTTVHRAISLLEKLGVISRVMNTVKTKEGKEYISESFILLHPDVLRKLTFPDECFDVESAYAELPHRDEDLPSDKSENVINTDLEHPVPIWNTPCSNMEHPRSNVEHIQDLDKNYKDLYINNKSSSSNINNNNNIGPRKKKDQEDDDERINRERMLRERVSADRIAKLINNAVIVDTLINIILSRDDGLFESISGEDFKDICLDILGYPHKISNYDKFIRKCVDNFLKDAERSTANSSKEVIKANNSRDNPSKRENDKRLRLSNEHDYDFAELEKQLLNKNKADSRLIEPVPESLNNEQVIK